ncbi:MAG: CoA transferase [Oligoflexia bacterium]|nr:CoA transferase [Oligoflexia bacterium]
MPLSGRTILDCSTLLPGPFIGKLLALKGARVLKVESPDRPDPARQLGRTLYDDLNELKELVPLNLTREADRARFHGLLGRADALIEGFRPATRLKLGLDEASLRAVNPRLCILSLVGFPEGDARAGRAGHDLNFEALTGMLSLFDEMPGLPLAELFGAYDGAFSLLAALDRVARGGEPSRVVMSFYDTLRAIQSRLAREYRATGEPPLPGRTLFSGLYPCYRLYAAADGRRVAVGALEEKYWRTVCGILGLSDLSGEGYATGERGRQVIARVQAAFASRPWPAWAPLFERADCCVEPVLDYSEVYRDGL